MERPAHSKTPAIQIFHQNGLHSVRFHEQHVGKYTKLPVGDFVTPQVQMKRLRSLLCQILKRSMSRPKENPTQSQVFTWNA